MPRSSYPFCSIIILNYYGEKIIASTLDSLLNLNFPKDKYEIIVVDNNSKDRSKEILNSYSKSHNQIKNIFLNKNLGFSKGNNVGIAQSKGEFVCLLNNDCVVDKNWLTELMDTALKDGKIFAVNSKILLYQRFINLKFETSKDADPFLVKIQKSNLLKYKLSKTSTLNIEKDGLGFSIEVPFDPVADSSIELSLLLTLKNKTRSKISIQNIINFKNNSIKIKKLSRINESVECILEIPTLSLGTSESVFDRIQNAGIMIFQDGYGRDIGAIVRKHQQFYEIDRGQFDREKEVYAACGAAVLYKRKILEKLGLLDENYFMYYEDVDICERARLLGFKTMYSPKALVRHFHALSSREWSTFFIYHAEKGRLLHVFFNFPFRVFQQQYFLMVLKTTLGIIFMCFYIPLRLRYILNSLKTKNKFMDFKRRLQDVKVVSFFLLFMPYLLIKRGMREFEKNNISREKNYADIISGRWYLK